jgi:hypothetical protein
LDIADDRRCELTRQARDFARRLLKLLARPLEVPLERRLIALLLLPLLFLRFLSLLLFLRLRLRLLFLLLLLLVVACRLTEGGRAYKAEHERRQAENL